MEQKRVDKVNYYLDIADAVLERSTCLRRHYGAILVRNDEIISTGYNGAPRGRQNCVDLGRCTREELQVPSGQRYELCRSVHAEANAIISAARSDALGSTLYPVSYTHLDVYKRQPWGRPWLAPRTRRRRRRGACPWSPGRSGRR